MDSMWCSRRQVLGTRNFDFECHFSVLMALGSRTKITTAGTYFEFKSIPGDRRMFGVQTIPPISYECTLGPR